MLEDDIQEALEKYNESRTVLKMIEGEIPNIDQEIIQKEAVKYHVSMN